MRRKFPPPYVLAMIVAFILFSSCAKEFMSNGSNHSSETDIGEAKAIFEASATDLREVDFGLSMGRPSTKSNNKSVIIPKWEKPFIVSSGKFTIFEVPLGGDVKKYAFTTYQKEGIQKNPEVKKVTTKLILKRDNETGDYIYFIATMVGKNEDKNGKEINYTKNRSFTGYIFISNLEGLCVGIYNCNSGVRRRAEFAKSKTKAAGNDGTIEGAIVQMFETPAEAYSYGETGGGDGGIVMYRCSTCENPKTGSLCLYCNPVITTPDYCRKCNGPYNNCYCCFICGDYPCTCYTPSYNCSYCGSYYCNGECRNTCYYCGSRYCSGGCQSTGGGGGGGGTTPDPDESCRDEKCATCGKCLNPTQSNCLECECKHQHINCELCGRCYKEGDDTCLPITKSNVHSSKCGTCDCWNEIFQDVYATREAKARAELRYINVRGGIGGKSFVSDMDGLLNSLKSANTLMIDIYPLYDFIEKKYMELKGVYMLSITNAFVEYGSIIMDLAFLHSSLESTFQVYSNFIKSKTGFEITKSAWTGAKSGYYAPLGRGSTAQLPISRANAINLNEELVIKEIRSNPLLQGSSHLNKVIMTDPRWLSTEGWMKYQYIHTLSGGEKITVHYLIQLKNGLINNIDDIKFIINP